MYRGDAGDPTQAFGLGCPSEALFLSQCPLRTLWREKDIRHDTLSALAAVNQELSTE
jgi:hypothetical protein